MKQEAALKARFTAALKAAQPTWLSLLQSTAGAPDRAIAGDGQTSWFEFKHATPDFRSPGIQELLCARLEEQSQCWYVIWAENAAGGGQRTLIAHPSAIRAIPRRSSGNKSANDVHAFAFCAGYDMKWLVQQVIKMHNNE